MPDEILRLYWYWAAERQNIFYARLAGKDEPFTKDPILQEYKFTNAYRASDRVSQYLIRHVIYPEDAGEYTPEDMVFRILLFKRFNLISTWQWIEQQFSSITLGNFDLNKYVDALDSLKNQGSVYNTCYNAGRVQGPYASKYGNHLLALQQAKQSGLFKRILEATSLKRVATVIEEIAGVGSWLAYQYAIDLNYSPHINFSENDYVVCGPGAMSGICKCFGDNVRSSDYEGIVRHMVESQNWFFDSYGLNFRDLYGRALHLIDCQNIFCEIAKYTRISHPHLSGKRKTVRFRFDYKPSKPKIEPFYPPKWSLDTTKLNWA